MSEEVRKSYTDGMCVMIDDRLPYDCAEIHGFICGLIAGGCPNDHHEFLKHISSIFGTSEEGFSPAMKGWLIRFFALVYEEFVAEEELTIPFEDDTTDMEKSLYRVSEWSDNFMSGFSSYHHSGKLSKDMEEIFRDLSAITRLILTPAIWSRTSSTRTTPRSASTSRAARSWALPSTASTIRDSASGPRAGSSLATP